MRALVAEDDPRLAAVTAETLRDRAFAVDVARDGEEAVLLGVLNPYDIILLDVMLPRQSGLGICAELRRSPDVTDETWPVGPLTVDSRTRRAATGWPGVSFPG